MTTMQSTRRRNSQQTKSIKIEDGRKVLNMGDFIKQSGHMLNDPMKIRLQSLNETRHSTWK